MAQTNISLQQTELFCWISQSFVEICATFGWKRTQGIFAILSFQFYLKLRSVVDGETINDT